MKHITIDAEMGVQVNWQLIPMLEPGSVLLLCADDISPASNVCEGRQGEPYPYARVMHLLSPTVTAVQRRVIDSMAEQQAQSLTRSANDAFIRHEDITSLHVIVWNVDGFGGAEALEAWVLQHYPPLPTIEYRTI